MKRQPITTSIVSIFRSCRQKWDYKFNQMLLPIAIYMPFIVGSCIGVGLNSLHRKSHVDDAFTHAIDYLLKLRQEYSEKKVLSEDDENIFIRTQYILEGVLYAYNKYYKKDIERTEVVHIEKKMKMEIVPETKLNKCFYIQGTPDEIIKNKKDFYYVYEIKTASQITKSYIEKYVFDNQTSTYFLLASKKYDIRGIYLDCIKKPSIYKGKKETEVKFQNRLKDFYYKVNPENVFYKDSYRRNKTVLDDLLKTFYHTIKEIRACQLDQNKIYKDRNSCYVYNNRACTYLPLCNYGENELTMQKYYKEEIPYYDK